VKVASSHPQFFTYRGRRLQKGSTTAWVDYDYPVVGAGLSAGPAVEVQDVRTVTDGLIEGSLQEGRASSVSMWIRGPDTPGEHSIDFLFYYEPTEKVGAMR